MYFVITLYHPCSAASSYIIKSVIHLFYIKKKHDAKWGRGGSNHNVSDVKRTKIVWRCSLIVKSAVKKYPKS